MALFRRIVEDYEARLSPADTSAQGHAASGKAEHERFEDGEVQFEIAARGLNIADGAELEIRVNGEPVGRGPVRRGRMSLRLSSQAGQTIPSIRSGDRLEVVHRSLVLLRGEFLPD